MSGDLINYQISLLLKQYLENTFLEELEQSIVMKSITYKLNQQILIEDFDDGALVLRRADCHLFAINLTAYHALLNTDGKRDVSEVAGLIVDLYDVTIDKAMEDLNALYNYLSNQEIVYPIIRISKENH